MKSALAELIKYQILSECVNSVTAELTIEASTFSRHSTHKCRAGNFIRLPALHGWCPLLQKDSWCSFLLETESTLGP
jgi:hypothetical protein